MYEIIFNEIFNAHIFHVKNINLCWNFEWVKEEESAGLVNSTSSAGCGAGFSEILWVPGESQNFSGTPF